MTDYTTGRPTFSRAPATELLVFSLDYAGRAIFGGHATNVYYEQMATHWGNWAKLFFNNKASRHMAPTSAQGTRRPTRGVWNW